MLRDLQGVLHFFIAIDNEVVHLLLNLPAGQKGDLDREQEKTCQPRYSDH